MDGIVDEETGTVSHKLELPGLLSFLAFGDFNAKVRGLNDFPKEEHPPIGITHYAFQVMVGLGSLMMLAALIYFWSLKKTKLHDKKFFWLFFTLMAPAGFLALEAGWTVTEVGRQPWIIHGIMRTSEAVTPVPGIQVTFFMYLAIYVVLATAIWWLMQRQIRVFNQETTIS